MLTLSTLQLLTSIEFFCHRCTKNHSKVIPFFSSQALSLAWHYHSFILVDDKMWTYLGWRISFYTKFSSWLLCKFIWSDSIVMFNYNFINADWKKKEFTYFHSKDVFMWCQWHVPLKLSLVRNWIWIDENWIILQN